MKFCNSNFSDFGIALSRKPSFLDFSRGIYLVSHALTVERGQIDFVLDVLIARGILIIPLRMYLSEQIMSSLLSFQEMKQE